MCNKHKHVMSFNQPLGNSREEDELTMEDIVGTDADELINRVISEMKNEIVREALKSLTTRERQIILLRYGLDELYKKTTDEVAQILKCYKSTITKEERKALIKMRHPRNARKLKDLLDD